ncbi:MAG TPA: hypothetical protein VJM57_02570 [Thermodesulfobacteriota bacterium]|nr:hypothetical protein [Thermodesulfobacteriota bacterium]
MRATKKKAPNEKPPVLKNLDALIFLLLFHGTDFLIRSKVAEKSVKSKAHEKEKKAR